MRWKKSKQLKFLSDAPVIRVATISALAGAVHGCEEGWRKGERIGGLFQLGLVEHPGELPEHVQQAMQEVRAHVVAGKPLSGKDKEALLFGSLIPDLLKTDKERWGGGGEPGGEGGGTV